MTNLPTAEWCRNGAAVRELNASVLDGLGIGPESWEDRQTAAALRIAARVLREDAKDRIHDIVLLAINDEISEHAAVSAIFAYLTGETS